MPFKDLREFIEAIDEIGELTTIEGADWDLEIGALSFEVATGQNAPALLFDKIRGYKAGYRVLSMPCNTDKRLALILGISAEAGRLEIVRQLRDKLIAPFKPVAPVEVKESPLFENVYTGDEVDLYKFPAPRWTASDGGRYIGTGDIVIAKDPDEGWLSLSVHRIQVHDKSIATILVDTGRNLGMVREKYWKKGRSCPVAVTLGGDPLQVSIAGMRIPRGISKYDYAGWWQNQPIEVIKGANGLPIPAYAEIVLEGEIMPPDVATRLEGPFAEFTGHYSAAAPESVFKVNRILHRNDPIILGVMPYLGPGVPTWTRGPLIAARTWEHLDRVVPGIKGVWSLDEFGQMRCLVVSLKQQYPGHAKHAALAALGYYPFSRKFVIVVDDDVDPTNLREVLFTVGQRARPEAFDLIRESWTSILDPLLDDPEKKRNRDFTGSTCIILACKPFNWIKEFPAPIAIEPELAQRVRKKWETLFRNI